jgi:hypothetical protein
MPNQLMAARDLPEAARVAMRIAVNSDSPKPLLYAAELLIEACMTTFGDQAALVDGRAAAAGWRSKKQPLSSPVPRSDRR